MSQNGYPLRLSGKLPTFQNLAQTRLGEKERKKRGKTKGAPARTPTKPTVGEARTRPPQGGRGREKQVRMPIHKPNN